MTNDVNKQTFLTIETVQMFYGNGTQLRTLLTSECEV